MIDPPLVDYTAEPAPQPTSESAAEPTGTPLEQFLARKTYPIPGASIKLHDFYETFGQWCEVHGHEVPTKAEVRDTLPPTVLQGIGNGNFNLLGNISFTQEPACAPLILTNGRLRAAWGTRRLRRSK